MFSNNLNKLSRKVLETARTAGWRIATAESCTGGLIAAALTGVAGSSDVLDRGFVTYSNEAKTEMIGVPASLIADHGAVSAPVAEAMASGALTRSTADIAVSVTGIAGPGGATPGKPVGLVFIGIARRGEPARSERHLIEGDRQSVREQAAERALTLLVDASEGSA